MEAENWGPSLHPLVCLVSVCVCVCVCVGGCVGVSACVHMCMHLYVTCMCLPS